ncbi:MAG: NADH-quinone oxidoreductase subunit NuoF [Deltaproteobacteria bacterium]|nr:NADH-quinone oxidoreductase subunit NuoF [Deltaproteobacteria bacterium]
MIVLTDRWKLERSYTIEVAEKAGAYVTARRALTEMEPAKLIDEVKAANVRGRGGAGFPAGVKWSFVKPVAGKPVYLVVNADEGEPGTFKDRSIMELDPHRLVEGCIISCWAIGAHVGYVYVRGELALSIRRLERAIAEAREKGYLGAKPFGRDFPIEIYVHRGAGAYICGEETALLNSLEGKRGEPRLKPPFPAVEGAFGAPTAVNNVETIASVPDIVKMGGAKWAALGQLPNDGGSRIYGVSGHVKKPGLYEAPVGITLRDLIYGLGGGIRGAENGRTLKGVIPGGASTPILRPDFLVHAPDEKHPLHKWHGKSEIDVPLGVDTMRALGTMLGTCCAIVMDDTVDMVEAARNLMRFFHHESCGQCTPCREGTAWIERILTAMVEERARPNELELLVDVSNEIMGTTICALADGATMAMLGFVKKFPEELRAYVKRSKAPGLTAGLGTGRALPVLGASSDVVPPGRLVLPRGESGTQRGGAS